MSGNIKNKVVLTELLHQNLKGDKQNSSKPLFLYVLKKQPFIMADDCFQIKVELLNGIQDDQLDEQMIYMITKYNYTIQYYKDSFSLLFKLLIKDMKPHQQINNQSSNKLVDIENDLQFKDVCEQMMIKFTKVPISRLTNHNQNYNKKFGLLFNTHSQQGLQKMVYQKQKDIEFKDIKDYETYLEIILDSESEQEQEQKEDSKLDCIYIDNSENQQTSKTIPIRKKIKKQNL